MEEYLFTKMISLVVGSLTIIASIGYGLLSFIGIGLGSALNGDQADSSAVDTAMITSGTLLLLGIITLVGSFLLKHKRLKFLYTGYCILLGAGFTAVFFVSYRALGSKIALFLLCIGIIYLLLSYWVIKKK
ncbi:hypothetical protein [Falsibacillus albus]|uniref:Uncharacterized protein n=1 Tax=Falsibacillus albus TaxID=2478915 RepID=A0A3L7JST8_9BACI|nr:hypothetical protein [Falsibacillus albus]RLQ93109.1 hypothetical protein D9X91_18945 [Falsibacillus albus]